MIFYLLNLSIAHYERPVETTPYYEGNFYDYGVVHEEILGFLMLTISLHSLFWHHKNLNQN